MSELKEELTQLKFYFNNFVNNFNLKQSKGIANGQNSKLVYLTSEQKNSKENQIEKEKQKYSPVRLYDTNKLNKDFYSKIRVRFQIDSEIFDHGTNQSILLVSVTCASSSEKVPADFRLANIVSKLIGKFSLKPMRKNKNGFMQWMVSIKSYPSLNKKFVFLGFAVDPIPSSTYRKINFLSTVKNDVLLYEERLPKGLKKRLLPFQRQGVLFGLRRNGRVYIADEMGTGKTLQALSIAYCYRDEWPLLIVAPASLRMIWALEIEKWFPFVLPSNVFVLVSSSQTFDFNKQIVITSYEMLSILEEPIKRQKFKVVIMDECHKIKAKHRKDKMSQSSASSIKILSYCQKTILLSGTPCISKPFNLYHQINSLRPGILGDTKSFAKNYCDMKTYTRRGNIVTDISGGRRLEELRLFLSKICMIRRLKKDVQKELPKLIRQILYVDIDKKIKNFKKEVSKFLAKTEGDAKKTEIDNLSDYQILGILKLDNVCEFLGNILCGTDDDNKVVVFAHHKIIIKGIVQFLTTQKVGHVIIQGHVLPEERVEAVKTFSSDPYCRVAVVSITAGNVGFDLSCSTRMIFAELPATQADLRQAESRVHRRNQLQCVNSYYVIAKNSLEQKRWNSLSRQLKHTTNLLNDEKEELVVDKIFSSSSANIRKNGNQNIKEKVVQKTLTQDLKETTKTNVDLFDLKTKRANKSKGLESKSAKSFLKIIIDEVNDAMENFEFGTEKTDQNRKGNDELIAREKSLEIIKKRTEMHCRKKMKGQTRVRYNSLPVCSLQITNEERKQKKKTIDVFQLRIGNKAFWKRKQNKTKHIKNVYFMISKVSNKVFIFSGPLENDFTGKVVEMDAITDNKASEYSNIPYILHPFINRRFFLRAKDFIKHWQSLGKVTQNKFSNRVLSWDSMLIKTNKKRTRSIKKPKNSKRVIEKETFVKSKNNELLNNEKIKIKRMKYVTKTLGKKVFINHIDQKFDCDDKPLCVTCNKLISPFSQSESKVQSIESFFCTHSCYSDFHLKTNQTHARRQIFNIEKGVCRMCKENIRGLYLQLKNLSPVQKYEKLKSLKSFSVLSENRILSICYKKNMSEGLLWNADHIVPVQFGGGACSIENFQTLCIGCHYSKTKEQSRKASVLRRETMDNNSLEKNAVTVDVERNSFKNKEKKVLKRKANFALQSLVGNVKGKKQSTPPFKKTIKDNRLQIFEHKDQKQISEYFE